MKVKICLPIVCCVVTVFACKQKNKTFKDAIKNESQNHIESTNTSVDTVAPGKLIVAGKNMGDLTLNRPANAMISLLGKPDFADAAMGKSVYVWYNNHNRKGYAVHVYCTTNMGNDDTPRIKVIRVSSPSFKTQNHLYAGVLIADAKKLHKLDSLGVFKLNGSNRKLYDDVNAGIAFDADRSGNITGIAVHEPGRSVLNAYMAFFGEVK